MSHRKRGNQSAHDPSASHYRSVSSHTEKQHHPTSRDAEADERAESEALQLFLDIEKLRREQWVEDQEKARLLQQQQQRLASSSQKQNTTSNSRRKSSTPSNDNTVSHVSGSLNMTSNIKLPSNTRTSTSSQPPNDMLHDVPDPHHNYEADEAEEEEENEDDDEDDELEEEEEEEPFWKYDEQSWIDEFHSREGSGHDWLVRVDEDFITDGFNLTGISQFFNDFEFALSMLTDDTFADELASDSEQTQAYIEADMLYGLIHARFLVTTAGLESVLEKYTQGVYGTCPRVICADEKLLPVGTSDLPHLDSVKAYCPRCEEVYKPKRTRHAVLDGAWFGTSFPHLFLLTYPDLKPVPYTADTIPNHFRTMTGLGNMKISNPIPAVVSADMSQRRKTQSANSSSSPALTPLSPSLSSSPAVAAAVNPTYISSKGPSFVPKLFGFRIHETAYRASLSAQRQQIEAAQNAPPPATHTGPKPSQVVQATVLQEVPSPLNNLTSTATPIQMTTAPLNHTNGSKNKSTGRK